MANNRAWIFASPCFSHALCTFDVTEADTEDGDGDVVRVRVRVGIEVGIEVRVVLRVVLRVEPKLSADSKSKPFAVAVAVHVHRVHAHAG